MVAWLLTFIYRNQPVHSSSFESPPLAEDPPRRRQVLHFRHFCQIDIDGRVAASHRANFSAIPDVLRSHNSLRG